MSKLFYLGDQESALINELLVHYQDGLERAMTKIANGENPHALTESEQDKVADHMQAILKWRRQFDLQREHGSWADIAHTEAKLVSLTTEVERLKSRLRIVARLAGQKDLEVEE